MLVVVAQIARPPEVVWRAFTDDTLFTAWMPGLRRVKVLVRDPSGLAHEVHFEFSTSLTYTLVYTYDLEKREVDWAPRLGARDAVKGSARIEPTESGSQLTYSLAQGAARTAGELVLGGPHSIVDAFVRWLESRK